jgi:uncharacterized RDD family membrane protein YckC
MNYYVGKDGLQSGPFTEDQLRQMLASGAVHSTDLCWRDGLSEWVPISQAMGIAPPPIPLGAPPAGYAGFWLRVVACIIDSIILLVPSYALGFVSGSVVAPALISNGSGKEATVVICALVGALLGGVAGWLYYACMESSRFQATPGKFTLGLRVTDASGGRIGFGRATGRHFAKIISAMALYIGFAMAGFTARKQAMHDIIAGCLVVRK